MTGRLYLMILLAFFYIGCKEKCESLILKDFLKDTISVINNKNDTTIVANVYYQYPIYLKGSKVKEKDLIGDNEFDRRWFGDIAFKFAKYGRLDYYIFPNQYYLLNGDSVFFTIYALKFNEDYTYKEVLKSYKSYDKYIDEIYNVFYDSPTMCFKNVKEEYNSDKVLLYAQNIRLKDKKRYASNSKISVITANIWIEMFFNTTTNSKYKAYLYIEDANNIAKSIYVKLNETKQEIKMSESYKRSLKDNK